MKKRLLDAIQDGDIKSAIIIAKELHAIKPSYALVRAHLILVDALEYGKGFDSLSAAWMEVRSA